MLSNIHLLERIKSQYIRFLTALHLQPAGHMKTFFGDFLSSFDIRARFDGTDAEFITLFGLVDGTMSILLAFPVDIVHLTSLALFVVFDVVEKNTTRTNRTIIVEYL